MLKHTDKLRKVILSLYDESYSRVKHLKDSSKGKTAYVLASGPSFGFYSKKFLNEFLKDKLVISIKQTYNTVPDHVDFHLLNFCNLNSYNYSNPSTITGWTVWDNMQPHQIIQSGARCDYILDTYKLGDGTANLDNSIAIQREFDRLSLDTSFSRPWGPGMMYELAIPLAMFLGCSKVVTIGWDLFGSAIEKYKEENKGMEQDHFFKGLSYEKTRTRVTKREIVSVIESTGQFYSLMKSKDVELNIVDPYSNNPASNLIPRVDL